MSLGVSVASLAHLYITRVAGQLATNAFPSVWGILACRVVPAWARRRVLLALRFGTAGEPHQSGEIWIAERLLRARRSKGG